MTSKLPLAVVTGAGSGIGLAIAERFIKEGFEIVAIGRRREPLEKLQSRFAGKVQIEICDLSKADQCAKTIQSITKPIDVLVNNAGIFERRSLNDSDDAVWATMFHTNLMSAVRLTRGLMPLIEKTRGSVVNVSSTLGLKPVAETGAYSALKAAMINWTQTLALEAAPKGVRANVVCPGIVDTPIHPFHADPDADKLKNLGGLQPLGRVGKPEDVAHAVWSLAGPGSEWMTGSVLNIDGGIYLA